ncbi:hypothetical protein KDW_07090 [Dictyobacter vulcani]|uniref:Uncharacterized protein n=1 Tax=Dictyobacter vulcani TaxID=2607529 RepID=A0A5J4KJE3_9CHLR|nr:hypothetical protein [Dictyobacter vulcani]GER86547.1 hypothetical protein KDW_07090 [Dictyobacter vulcani]
MNRLYTLRMNFLVFFIVVVLMVLIAFLCLATQVQPLARSIQLDAFYPYN